MMGASAPISQTLFESKRVVACSEAHSSDTSRTPASSRGAREAMARRLADDSSGLPVNQLINYCVRVEFWQVGHFGDAMCDTQDSVAVRDKGHRAPLYRMQ
jgi:hypothetical protein